MKIDELTIGEARELAQLFGGKQAEQQTPWKVGEMWMFRTVTMIQTGRVKAIMGPMVVLEDAAWIADTGRFYDFLKTGEPKEAEPFPDGCVVNTGALIDACCVPKLIVVQK